MDSPSSASKQGQSGNTIIFGPVEYTFTASDGNLEAWGSALRRRSANELYYLLGNVIKFEGANGSTKAMLDMEGTTYFAGSRVD